MLPSREERWGKTVDRVHIIFPNVIGKSQAYIAKSGEGLHCLCLSRDVFKIAFRQPSPAIHSFYWNNKNYSNQFMILFNEL